MKEFLCWSPLGPPHHGALQHRCWAEPTWERTKLSGAVGRTCQAVTCCTQHADGTGRSHNFSANRGDSEHVNHPNASKCPPNTKQGAPGLAATTLLCLGSAGFDMLYLHDAVLLGGSHTEASCNTYYIILNHTMSYFKVTPTIHKLTWIT